ncbi:MAG: hypothetical protein R2865_09005 [Deinococcales bacterium]
MSLLVAPIAHEDDAERALKTAWELRESFEGLTKLLRMGMVRKHAFLRLWLTTLSDMGFGRCSELSG